MTQAYTKVRNHPEVARFLSGERPMEELPAWLDERVDGSYCPTCDEPMTQGEVMSGRCEGCVDAEGPDTVCRCLGLAPGLRGDHGFHFDADGHAVERCPTYWRRHGKEVFTLDAGPWAGRRLGLRDQSPEESRMSGQEGLL